jgi:hypothetical protein
MEIARAGGDPGAAKENRIRLLKHPAKKDYP